MNFMKAIVAAGLVAASTSAFAADITGAGATFPFPLYSKWADAYKNRTVMCCPTAPSPLYPPS
jgi:phosphate transport system substrate-binding protein